MSSIRSIGCHTPAALPRGQSPSHQKAKAMQVPSIRPGEPPVHAPTVYQLHRNAAECVELAEEAPSSAHRSFFIEMAERWLTLAELVAQRQNDTC